MPNADTTLPRDSVNVGFKLPVGGKAHGVVQVAHASRLVAAAVQAGDSGGFLEKRAPGWVK